MSTYSVNPQVMQALQGTGTAAATSTKTKKKSSLDMDDFLKLLVTQMTYQDPLGGTSGDSSSTGFLTQLAQITMLEQLSQISSSLAAGQAYSMIGKYVYISSGTDLILGRVDGVITEGGTSYLMVGGETYSLSDVYAAMDGTAVGASNDEVLKSAGLIGRNVTAAVTDDQGAETAVSGRVDKVVVQNGLIYLVVGGKYVPLGSIIEVSDPDGAEPAQEPAIPETAPEGESV